LEGGFLFCGLVKKERRKMAAERDQKTEREDKIDDLVDREVFVFRSPGILSGGLINASLFKNRCLVVGGFVEASLVRDPRHIDIITKCSNNVFSGGMVTGSPVFVNFDGTHNKDLNVAATLLIWGRLCVQIFCLPSPEYIEKEKQTLEAYFSKLWADLFDDESCFKIDITFPSRRSVAFNISVDPPNAAGFGLIHKSVYLTQDEIDDDPSMVVLREF
jgi:hypothetical protein